MALYEFNKKDTKPTDLYHHHHIHLKRCCDTLSLHSLCHTNAIMNRDLYHGSRLAEASVSLHNSSSSGRTAQTAHWNTHRTLRCRYSIMLSAWTPVCVQVCYTFVWLWNMDAIRKGRIQTRWLLHSYAEDGHEHYVDGQNDEWGPNISNKIRERRLRLAGHCVRHSELEVSNLVLWEPTQGKFNRESQRLTYVDRLRKDTGLQTTAELKTLMKDKC